MSKAQAATLRLALERIQVRLYTHTAAASTVVYFVVLEVLRSTTMMQYAIPADTHRRMVQRFAHAQRFSAHSIILPTAMCQAYVSGMNRESDYPEALKRISRYITCLVYTHRTKCSQREMLKSVPC